MIATAPLNSNLLFALTILSFALHASAVSPTAFGATAAAFQENEEFGVSDAELQSYARAKKRVEEIATFWEESIERSSSPDVLRKVRENEIEIAIGLEGLTTERYREIDDHVSGATGRPDAE